ncbi:MAG: glycosyltransferase [Candidatus Methylacidiphilales bacterium]
MRSTKVHFIGGEGIGWALDHDLAHVRASAVGVVEEASLEECDIIHSVWWRALLDIPTAVLEKKVVLASIADDPSIMLAEAKAGWLARYVDFWLCEYTESLHQMTRSGFRGYRFPSPIDTGLFTPCADRGAAKAAFCRKHGLDEKDYLIGNFFKDSAMGDVRSPKKQKGADFFLECLKAFQETGARFRVVLAGPRRHWILARCKEHAIPYLYLGTETQDDDLKINTLDHGEIPGLLHALDVYFVPSRWEGAPNATLECAATRTPIVSTPVAQGLDILSPRQFVTTPGQAVALLEADRKDRILSGFLDYAQDHIRRNNTFAATRERLRHLYDLASRCRKKRTVRWFVPGTRSKSLHRRLRAVANRKTDKRISLGCSPSGEAEVDKALCLLLPELAVSLKKIGVSSEVNGNTGYQWTFGGEPIQARSATTVWVPLGDLNGESLVAGVPSSATIVFPGTAEMERWGSWTDGRACAVAPLPAVTRSRPLEDGGTENIWVIETMPDEEVLQYVQGQRVGLDALIKGDGTLFVTRETCPIRSGLQRAQSLGMPVVSMVPQHREYIHFGGGVAHDVAGAARLLKEVVNHRDQFVRLLWPPSLDEYAVRLLEAHQVALARRG